MRAVIGEDDSALRAMWNQLKQDPNPEMMANFENLLSKLSSDIQRKSAEQVNMESTFKNLNRSHEGLLKELYEEMEAQIQRERQLIRREEERKLEKATKELQDVLDLKDSHLQEVLSHQAQLEKQLEVSGQEGQSVHLTRCSSITAFCS